MRRIVIVFVIIFMPLLASAITCIAEIDGIEYIIITEDKSAVVTNNDIPYKNDVIIPATIIYDGITCNVTSIGDYAFYNCQGLTSVTIPNSVTTIGEYAFEGCSGLNSVTVLCPIVGDWFCCHPNITKVILGEDVTSISDLAFSGCYGLTSVTIPNKVTSIGDRAFSGCKLESVTSLNPIPPSIQPFTFENQIKQTATLNVPIGYMTDYMMAPYWKDFKDIKEVNIDGIENTAYTITDIIGQKVRIYSITGQIVRTMDADQLQQLNEILPIGIYFIGGKKVIVK